jgi:hypothetical protein
MPAIPADRARAGFFLLAPRDYLHADFGDVIAISRYFTPRISAMRIARCGCRRFEARFDSRQGDSQTSALN